jgi:methionine salvage enolase-phosphatase E1
VEDVRWACERLQKLTDRQWRDAFRAGNFTADVTARYVARIRQKITEGLELR